MKRALITVPILFLLCVMTVGSAFAEEKGKKDTMMKELSKEFTKAGVNKNDMETVDNSAKNLLAKGATGDEIKGFIGSVKKIGLNSEEITASLNVMSNLVDEGIKPKAAGALVSEAAQDAKAQGLKGKDLAAKVQETIEKQKKNYYESMKRKKKRAKGNKVKGEKTKIIEEKK